MSIYSEKTSAPIQKSKNIASVATSKHPEDVSLDLFNPLKVDKSSQESSGVLILQELGNSTESKIVINSVPFDSDSDLVRRECVVLNALRSECGNYLTIESEDLEMSITEESLEELKDAFEAVLVISWELYILGDTQKMTQGALQLRKHLVDTYRLI
ncbi:MAG: hypothetical protein OXF84_00085 [Bacteroidetes bacterium]|nr:hypothetical protein [Bacteroidota bacterium]